MNFRIVTALFLFASFSGYSQEYHPLLSNSGWCCETCVGTGCVYIEYPKTGVDYINDELYYIIDNSSFGHFYLQEDPISKRIWFLNDGEKELLYDFTLSESDTFQIEILDSIDATYIVEMVDTITTLAGHRKRWILNLMDTLMVGPDTVERSLTWIEGIGSTYGPVYQNNIPNWYHGTCLEGVYSSARVQIYQGYCNYIGGFWPEECKFISNNIEEYTVEPTIVFFNDYGELEISSDELITQIRIYDVKGTLLGTHENSSIDRYLKISNHLPPGIYFCETVTESRSNHCTKAIKTVKSL